jgi:hypothetical protein
MIKLLGGIVAIGCILCASLESPPTQAQTQDLVLGVNASMGSLSVEQQNAILAELHAAGIHYIRAGIAPDDKGVDFARRAQAQGIRIDWLKLEQGPLTTAVRRRIRLSPTVRCPSLLKSVEGTP